MTFRDDGPFGRIPMERELDEAIALLERCADEMNYDEFDDPAQRALQHDVSAFLASSVPAQPAAPEPHYAEQLGLNPAPGYAAPEPSAECHVGAPECPQCHAIESTVNGRLKPTDTWVSLLASRQELIARAEAAEAAARERLDQDWKRRHAAWLEQQAREVAAHAETRKALGAIGPHVIYLREELESTRGDLAKALERSEAERKVLEACALVGHAHYDTGHPLDFTDDDLDRIGEAELARRSGT